MDKSFFFLEHWLKNRWICRLVLDKNIMANMVRITIPKSIYCCSNLIDFIKFIARTRVGIQKHLVKCVGFILFNRSDHSHSLDVL